MHTLLNVQYVHIIKLGTHVHVLSDCTWSLTWMFEGTVSDICQNKSESKSLIINDQTMIFFILQILQAFNTFLMSVLTISVNNWFVSLPGYLWDG